MRESVLAQARHAQIALLAKNLRFFKVRKHQKRPLLASEEYMRCRAGVYSRRFAPDTKGVILERTRRIWALPSPRWRVRFFASLRMTVGGDRRIAPDTKGFFPRSRSEHIAFSLCEKISRSPRGEHILFARRKRPLSVLSHLKKS